MKSREVAAVRVWGAGVIAAIAVATASAQAPPPPPSPTAEVPLERLYPVTPLAQRDWREVLPAPGRWPAVWNGRVAVAEASGITFTDLAGRVIRSIAFPAQSGLHRVLQSGPPVAFRDLPVRDFPGYEYNDASGREPVDRVVMLDRDGAQTASFVVTGRWHTTVAPHGGALVKHGPLGLAQRHGVEKPEVAGYTVYDRAGKALATVARESRLFFADVSDAGWTLALERTLPEDPKAVAFGPPVPIDNPVTGWALVDARGAVVQRGTADRVDQLVFTPAGGHAVVGTVSEDRAAGGWRRRLRVLDLKGQTVGELADMTGMLFGQVTGDAALVLPRFASADDPWRLVEIALFDCAAGAVKQRFACDVQTARVQSFLSRAGYLLVYLEPFEDRGKPVLLVFHVATGKTVYAGELFAPPRSQHLNFVSYGDGEQVLLASEKSLWLTSGAIAEAFAAGGKSR